MSLPRETIRSQQTYRMASGRLVYVQDMNGQKVTYTKVGEVDRYEVSLGRFAAFVTAAVPNQ